MRAGRRGVKRLDLSAMREVLKDQRVWASIGTVIQPDGEAGAEHWELVAGDADAVVDILVEVVLAPANIEVTARLNMLGVIQVPDVGDEVLVVFPDGQVDWMPVIVARMSTGSVPNPSGQGPSPTTILICPPPGGRVLVHDGDGDAEELVKRSEFLSHGHATAATGPVSPPIVAPDPPTSPTIFPGTTVLKAK